MERAVTGATVGIKKFPRFQQQITLGVDFATAVQMTVLNYARLFNWTAVGFFWGEGRRRRSLDGAQRSQQWPAGGALPPAVPAAFSSTLVDAVGRTATSVTLRVRELLVPHSSVSQFVFLCMNCCKADAHYQVTMFQAGRDFDLNVFLFVLLDETLCFWFHVQNQSFL